MVRDTTYKLHKKKETYSNTREEDDYLIMMRDVLG